MGNKLLSKSPERMPVLFDDFFKPWNEWFGNGGSLWGGVSSIPAVNITEGKDNYEVSLAAPGMKKEDFKIAVDSNMLTISSEKEETKKDEGKKFTRKEYNYSSFSRSFTLPDEINQNKIEAKYEDGVLRLILSRREEVKKSSAKQIAVN